MESETKLEWTEEELDKLVHACSATLDRADELLDEATLEVDQIKLARALEPLRIEIEGLRSDVERWAKTTACLAQALGEINQAFGEIKHAVIGQCGGAVTIPPRVPPRLRRLSVVETPTEPEGA